MSMAFENATPRPWMKDKYGSLRSSNGDLVTVYDLGASIAMTSPAEEERANAELIVTAVNAHADLVEALKAVIRFLPIGFASTGRPDAARDQNAALQEARDKAEAALKLARAET